jgi:hypothetical protein
MDYLQNLFIDDSQKKLGTQYLSNIVKYKILIKKNVLSNEEYLYINGQLEDDIENLENLIYSPNEKYFFDTPQKVYSFRIELMNIIDQIIDNINT